MSKTLKTIVFFILAIVIIFASAAVYARYILPKRSFPQVEGELKVSGLNGRVDIYRDDYGIPHIYATSIHDIFFAQGYVHAQDRFWQMDFWRHQGAGRLSELLGENTLDIDRFIRTLGWERIAKQELAAMDEQSRAILEAYAEGVNAYLKEHKGATLSMEYAFLPIINPGYEPAPWEPIHTITWAKAMAWDLAGNMDVEIDRARLLKHLPPEQVEKLFPPYPQDHPYIVPNPHITTSETQPPDALTTLVVYTDPAWRDIAGQLASLNASLGGQFEGIGSNNWVISGKLTDTGMPYLANDPHLGVQLPSIWYEVDLQCMPVTADCPYQVTGFSFAGVPGVVIGHNANIAWGFTNVGPDVMDLYIEKINPDNPKQYEYNGQWVDMEIVKETIVVAGGENIELEVQLTRHGPIITDVYELTDFDQEAGIDVPSNFAIALRWTALEPSCVFCAIWEFNNAANWDEFRQAASKFAVPAQNLVYADIEGNIGYQTPGNIPIRVEGHDGQLPVPGWTDQYEWQGYIPFEQLPFAFNPPSGYVVTANNAVVPDVYPYLITKNWAYGYRAGRIVEMLENSPGVITKAYIQQMQGDNMDLLARDLVPIILQIPSTNEQQQTAQSLLSNWDYQMDMNSPAAALYASFWRHFLDLTFTDQLPEFYYPSGGSNWREVIRQALLQEDDTWWDDVNTPEIETFEDIVQQALTAAVDELNQTLGKNPSKWAWGDLHTVSFTHQVMSSFPLINNIFNRGPFPTSGGSAIVNATGWSTRSPYTVRALPSMRMIVDLSNLQNSLTMHTTGQSGHPYHPHYIDMADPWRMIQYHPMLWEASAVEGSAEAHLVLMP